MFVGGQVLPSGKWIFPGLCVCWWAGAAGADVPRAMEPEGVPFLIRGLDARVDGLTRGFGTPCLFWGFGTLID